MSQSDLEQYRKVIIDFYASQMNSHSRLIIGVAVLVLTLVQIRQRMPFFGFPQMLVIYLAVFFTSSALWHLLMRLLAYGIMINTIVHYSGRKTEKDLQIEEKFSTPGQFATAAVNRAISEKSKLLAIWPLRLQFFVKPKHQWKGVVICGTLGFWTTLLLWILESL